MEQTPQDSANMYLLAADAILLLHTLFVVFVVLGLILIFIGKARAWPWVRNPWFRLIHLIAIGVVVVQSWMGIICPLTSLEMFLRSRAGDDVYSGSFISHWIQAFLYYEVPLWVFATGYTTFGALVVVSWVRIRPRRFKKNKTV
jgi:glucan phosphoethanolaminetransferase (alkaline phosphatase superfamily)